jgi:hypothetical protein
MDKQRLISVKGDPYIGYMRVMALNFNLTELEVKVAAELLREFEFYLLQSNKQLAWELTCSAKTNKKIKDKLELKDASYNNVKASLKKKNLLTNAGFREGVYLADIKFIFSNEVGSYN